MDASPGGSFSPCGYVRRCLNRRSGEDLRALAHVKRFLECLTGDPDFRQAFSDGMERGRSACRTRRIDLDPVEVAPLWRTPLRWQVPLDELARYPKLVVWKDWKDDLSQYAARWRDAGSAPQMDLRLRSWRRRQVNRCDSELGDSRHFLSHSLLAFELSKGCSVGCPFCGVSAGRLKGVFQRTPAHVKLWRNILEVCVEKFGSATRAGSCYFATEPADNPDYLAFLADYRDVTGILPQTTTAVPLRDIAWTREMLRMTRERLDVPARFSILNLATLRRVHDLFSPEELLDVELIQQQPQSLIPKVVVGRQRKRSTRSGKSHLTFADCSDQVLPDLGTISCLSGILVNMVDGAVRLISPCRASNRWPSGFRVHARGSFDDAASFRTFIEKVTDENMSLHVAASNRVGFRPDVAYESTPEGFTLRAARTLHRVAGPAFLGHLGRLLCEGDRSAGEVIGELVKDGADLFAVTDMIQQLFERGLLDDDPAVMNNPGTPVSPAR